MTSIYDVLRRPILTEKSSHQYGKLNQYVFEVATDATKSMIKYGLYSFFDHAFSCICCHLEYKLIQLSILVA